MIANEVVEVETREVVPMESSPGPEMNQRSMESRTGRNKQRYNAQGDRLVAGVVPVSEDHETVMLIQSSSGKGWVLPKGGWEVDEQCEEAARREAWEEAGIDVTVHSFLGEIPETRPPKATEGLSRKYIYHFYEATVSSVMAQWPENNRVRRWMKFQQAWEALEARPELQKALLLTTLLKR